jgi:hypothetical protein
MTTTLKDLTDDELNKLWTSAYALYQVRATAYMQETLDAIWGEFLARKVK